MKSKILSVTTYLSMLIIFFLSVFSCEKEIDVELKDTEPKLVVEGVIENGEFAYVSLSKSSPYFANIDTNSFNNMFISDALVIVSDGIEYDTLKYDTIPFFPPFRFQGSKIKGKENTTYSLRIEYNNTIYTATTKILQVIPIDSVRYQYRMGSDSLGLLRFYANDPVDQTNFYRTSCLDLNTDISSEIMTWLYPSNSVTDDVMFNGKKVNAAMYKGKNPTKSPEYYREHSEDWWAFKMDDDIIVRLSQIDYQGFMFWRTTEQVVQTGDNPFAAPTTVQTNIYPKALGCWCGYASSTKRVIITEDILIP